jgi:hypothetical protein
MLPKSFVEKIKTTHVMFNNFFAKIVPVMR